jgi:hypothetical protein
MISVLCIQKDSNYLQIPNLDLWDYVRNAYNFCGDNPVICHPPCQQWSRLKAFAKEDKLEKELALFCWEKIQVNGGIFEHPLGSSFFKFVNADRKKMFVVHQSWWGFPARKPTILYFNNFSPLATPISFDAIQTTVDKIAYRSRSKMPLNFCKWLVSCIDDKLLLSEKAKTPPVAIAEEFKQENTLEGMYSIL